jgi:UDP-glucose 4-epimerase
MDWYAPVTLSFCVKHCVGCGVVLLSTPAASFALTWNTAKFLLGWRPRFDPKRLIEEDWSYQRSSADPRRVWYPG